MTDIKSLQEKANRWDWLISGIKSRQGAQILGGERTISRNRDQDLMRFDFWCTPEELASRIDKEISNGKSRT